MTEWIEGMCCDCQYGIEHPEIMICGSYDENERCPRMRMDGSCYVMPKEDEKNA